MSDHQIIFSGAMIRALLSGSKTMTRRLAWRTNKKNGVIYETAWQRVKAGDRLWVRETFAPRFNEYGTAFDENPRYVKYRADNHPNDTPQNPDDWHRWPKAWCSPIHMPRWASRLTLVVTATKIERLQDISEVDARAEGIRYLRVRCYGTDNPDGTTGTSPQAAFAALWESLHGVGSIAANPEIVAITYIVHRTNIDHMKADDA